MRGDFPFAGVVGMDSAKRALLLLAIDPGLRGVLIAAGPGMAKSLLARTSHPLFEGAVVEVPLGITEDRLLGGLDLERTLVSGRRQVADGLLVRANRGLVYGDEVNLFEEQISHLIAEALDTGVVRVERDGVSGAFSARFAFLGTYDPGEGEVNGALSDCVGLHVAELSRLSGLERVELLRRAEAFDADPRVFADRFAAEMEALTESVARGRDRLAKVKLTVNHRRWLSEVALGFGVEGHRADIFAVRAARAHAAFMGRMRVQEEDLEAAVEFVLRPRARAISPESLASGIRPDRAPQPETEQPPPDSEETLMPGVDDSARVELPSLPGGSAGRRRGSPVETTNWDRGRYVRAVARRPGASRIGIHATLRAAAPFQPRRRRLAGKPAVRIEQSDLRFKQFRQKSGMLIVFVLDASGSMAVNRIRQAKGALMRLLREAYLHRDKVALVSFRGSRAEVMLPPTRSVELAKRALDAMPVGGGTPLAEGLRTAFETARRARSADGREAMLVVLTDGRANVGRGGGDSIQQELGQVGSAIQRAQLASVVIDTKQRAVSSGEAARLADVLGAHYVHLPRPDSDAVYDAVTAAIRPGRSARSRDRG